MRTTALSILLAIAGLVSVASSLQPPDFSGNWTAVTDAPANLPAAPSAVLGPRFAIQQDAATLTMTRPFREDLIVLTYKLDGSRTHYKVPGRMCEGDAEYIETAVWEDGALALTLVGTIQPGGGPVRTQSIKRLLRREGDTLVVQGSMTQAGQTRAVGTVYKRSDPMPPPAPAKTGVKGTSATIAQLAWLPGFWVGTTPGTGTAPGLTIEERWTPAASGGILGLGRSTRGTSLASFEFLCIAEKEGSLVYTAMPDGRTTPTHFVLTSITADSATFENPAHDFPKVVRYTRRADGTLETTISGAANQRTQSFVLTRQ